MNDKSGLLPTFKNFIARIPAHSPTEGTRGAASRGTANTDMTATIISSRKAPQFTRITGRPDQIFATPTNA